SSVAMSGRLLISKKMWCLGVRGDGHYFSSNSHFSRRAHPYRWPPAGRPPQRAAHVAYPLACAYPLASIPIRMRNEPMPHFTLREAADHLGVHYMTMYRYVRLGLIPAVKTAGSWRVTAVDLESFARPQAG